MRRRLDWSSLTWMLSAVLLPRTLANRASMNLRLEQQALQAYYINLEDARVRRVHMENKLGAAMLSAERVVAVDHRRVDVGEFDKDYVIPQGLAEHLDDPEASKALPSIRNGTVACYLSHIRLLERLQKDKLGNQSLALILEDDVSIPDSWVPQLKAVIAAAPEDWTVLKVAGWGSAREADRVSVGDGTWFWSKVAQPVVSFFTGSIRPRQHLVTYKARPPFRAVSSSGPQKQTTFYYAGSSGYLVRGASLPTLIQHLKSQRISDFDEMLLSAGKHNSYEFWPHVFDASGDHKMSSLHSALVEHEGVRRL